MPDDNLTPQLRAARVAAAFHQRRKLHVHDIQKLTGLSRRASYDLLDTLSGNGGIPIRQTGEGWWEMCDGSSPSPEYRPAVRPAFKIHPNTRASIAFAFVERPRRRTGELAARTGLQWSEVRWLLRQMQRAGLGIRETATDVWEVWRDEC